MSKGIKGNRIDKVVQTDDSSLMIYLKSGNQLKFYAGMCDYDDCKLYCEHIDNHKNYDDDEEDY